MQERLELLKCIEALEVEVVLGKERFKILGGFPLDRLNNTQGGCENDGSSSGIFFQCY